MSFPCNIPTHFLQDAAVLLHHLPDYPLIFKADPHRNQLLREIGSKFNLLTNHGDSLVTLTSSNTYSDGLFSMTLSDYIHSFSSRSQQLANESLYLFGNNYEGIWSTMREAYVIPPCRGCDIAGAATIGLGGQLSGVSWHFHGPGFSEAIIGRKMWFLYPPEVKSPPGHHPNRSVQQWYSDIYPTLTNITLARETTMDSTAASALIEDSTNTNTDTSSLFIESSGDSSSARSRYGEVANRSPRLWECTIGPGEMLYFPAMWMHATLNLDEYNLFVSLFLDLQLMDSAKEKV